MRKMLHFGVAAALALGLQACDQSPTQPSGSTGSATSTKLTIGGSVTVTAIGQTFQLTATVVASNQATRDVTAEAVWASDDPSVATVSAGGLVTVVSVGTCTISASYTSVTGTRLVSALLPARGLSLTGNLALTGVGDTSQLRAMATLMNGDTVDVTKYANWTTMIVPSVVSVSKGLLTANALGAGRIDATYSGILAFKQLTVTPPGTYVVSGFVKLPGHAGVGGFNVLDTQSGRSAVTTSTGGYGPGWYTLGGLAGSTRLTFDKAGYEPADLTVSGPGTDGSADGEVKVQQLYRIAAGGTVQTTIAPHDVQYNANPSGPCVNCRMIRVVNPASGTLHLDLTWNLKPAALNVWVNGQRFDGPSGGPLTVDVPVDGGELVFYVGVAGDPGYVTITLKTSIQADVRDIVRPWTLPNSSNTMAAFPSFAAERPSGRGTGFNTRPASRRRTSTSHSSR